MKSQAVAIGYVTRSALSKYQLIAFSRRRLANSFVRIQLLADDGGLPTYWKKNNSSFYSFGTAE